MADIQFIEDLVRKDKRSTIYMGPILVLIGLGIALGLRVDATDPVLYWVESIAKWVLGGCLAAFSAYSFIKDLGPVEKDERFQILSATPEKIVWAHILVTKTNGQPSSAMLKLYLDDGKQNGLGIPLGDDASERALAFVREVAPRAALGFSPDREAQFTKDPASLRVS